MVNKTTVIANFNCTFGKSNEPMMNYFDTIIFPALSSDIIRKKGDDEFFFRNVKIDKLKDERYVLAGILVKKTKLEVKTEYDNTLGVTFTNKFYDAAPISLFTIFLDNHRMTYTTNQKGSPDIRSFAATVKDIIKKYIVEYNGALPKEKKIPYPVIDIVNIPSATSIKEQLKMVKKIDKLTFKLFNPNGDFKMSAVYANMVGQLDVLGAKKGSFVVNSPTKLDNVVDTITGTKGLAEAMLEVKYINGGEGRIEHDKMGEKFKIEFPDQPSFDTVQEVVVDTLKDNESLNTVSEENQDIFESNKGKVISLFSHRAR